MTAAPLRAYSVWCVVFPEFEPETVNAFSPGQAKMDRWRSITDPYPDVPYLSMRARVAGPPAAPPDFHRVADSRGYPLARVGDRLRCGRVTGVIVGVNGSANWDVRVDEGPGEGNVVNVHPGDCEYLSGAYSAV